MKNVLTILLCSLAFISLTAQDDVRTLENFEALSVSGGFDISIYEGSPKAEITVNRGELEGVKMEVKRGELIIKYQSKKSGWGWNSGSHNIDIDLYVPNLVEISTSAGADVYGEFAFEADDFEAEASSGSVMSIEVIANFIEADVSSGAVLEIEGKGQTLDVDVSSGASFKGKKLICEKVDADASSGASAKVHATKKIVADASSGASIRYKGNPTNKDLDPGKWSGGSISEM